MKMGNLMLNVLLVVLVILLVTSLVINVMTAVRDHEFVTDLTSIKPPKGTDLLNAMCFLHKCESANPSQVIDDKTKKCNLLDNLKIPLLQLVLLSIPKSAKFFDVSSNACASLSQDDINKIQALYTFDKVEARQILNNNFEYINYIYSHKDTKACMKDFFGIFTAAMAKYPDTSHFETATGNAADNFMKCYRNLKTRDRKYIAIVLKDIVHLELVNLL